MIEDPFILDEQVKIDARANIMQHLISNFKGKYVIYLAYIGEFNINNHQSPMVHKFQYGKTKYIEKEIRDNEQVFKEFKIVAAFEILDGVDLNEEFIEFLVQADVKTTHIVDGVVYEDIVYSKPECSMDHIIKLMEGVAYSSFENVDINGLINENQEFKYKLSRCIQEFEKNIENVNNDVKSIVSSASSEIMKKDAEIAALNADLTKKKTEILKKNVEDIKQKSTIQLLNLRNKVEM